VHNDYIQNCGTGSDLGIGIIFANFVEIASAIYRLAQTRHRFRPRLTIYEGTSIISKALRQAV
jgi:hypothetical protein